MIRCPVCGEGMELVIELRRRYAPEAVEVVAGSHGPELLYLGWGEQIDDTPQYLMCSNEECLHEVAPDEPLSNEWEAVLRASLPREEG